MDHGWPGGQSSAAQTSSKKKGRVTSPGRPGLEFRIADPFTDSLARLNGDEQVESRKTGK